MPMLKRGYGAARNLRGKSGARFPPSTVVVAAVTSRKNRLAVVVVLRTVAAAAAAAAAAARAAARTAAAEAEAAAAAAAAAGGGTCHISNTGSSGNHQDMRDMLMFKTERVFQHVCSFAEIPFGKNSFRGRFGLVLQMFLALKSRLFETCF